MKIFIDSADIEEIKKAFSWGIIDGITTNPTLLKRAVEKYNINSLEEYIIKILKIAKNLPVSLEILAEKQQNKSLEESMFYEAIQLYEIFNKISNNVVIKIPINPLISEDKDTIYDSLKVIKKLSEKGIPVNCTLIFTPEQALLAAKAGAKYLSPFAGRIDDLIRKNNNIHFEKTDYFPSKGFKIKNEILEDNGIISGVDLVEKITKLLKNYDYSCEVIAASTRNPRQVRECALVGAHISTIPFKVLEKMLYHTKTLEGMQNFVSDIIEDYKNIIYKEK